MLLVNPGSNPQVVYDHPDTVRAHIAFLAEADAETLADIANGLLADLEAARRDLRANLAEANDMMIGVVENGPWVLIEDPQLRRIVGEYVADACHSIAAAAGLDDAMERAHDAMPQRLATSLPGGVQIERAREALGQETER